MSEQPFEKLIEEQQFKLRNVKLLFDVVDLRVLFLEISQKIVKLQHTLKYALELLREPGNGALLALDLIPHVLQLELSGWKK